MKLYELTIAYSNLLEMAEDTEGDFSEALEELNDSIDIKVENTIKVIRTLEAKSKAYKEEKDRFAARQKTVDKSIAYLKDHIKESMLQVGMKKVEGKLFNASVANNGKTSLKVSDEKLIPEKYFTVEQIKKRNNEAIRKKIEEGGTVKGAELVRGTHLRIS